MNFNFIKMALGQIQIAGSRELELIKRLFESFGACFWKRALMSGILLVEEPLFPTAGKG